MKIIAVDNFDTGTVDDRLIAENVLPFFGRLIVDHLNQLEGEAGRRYFKLVQDEHNLFVYEP